MKTKQFITTLVAPLLFTACDAKKSPEKRMDEGAQKVQEGLEEMSDAASEKTAEVIEKANEKTQELIDEADKKLEPTPQRE